MLSFVSLSPYVCRQRKDKVGKWIYLCGAYEEPSYIYSIKVSYMQSMVFFVSINFILLSYDRDDDSP